MPERVLAVDTFVSEYGAHVDAQAAAIFVGAGLSVAAGYPSWDELVSPYRRALGVDRLDDLPLLVQYYQDAEKDGPETVRSDIIAACRRPSAGPVEAHRRIVRLPVPDIWTTNYDCLLEAAAEELGIESQAYVEDADLAASRAVVKRVYKMHGSVGSAAASDLLVISRDDFEQYPTTHPRFWQLLRAHFMTRSFLFLGFSLSDPNITEIFRLARLYTPTVQRPHYAIMRTETGPDSRLAELRRPDLARVGVQVVEIAEFHELDTVLARLDARCRPPRAYVSGSVQPDDPQRERIETLAVELGRQLGPHENVRLMAGGELGALVGYAMSAARLSAGTYHPDDFVVIRRVTQTELGPPNRRIGSMVFDGEKAEPLRSKAFAQVRVVVVLGGADGSREEIRQAKALGMGVIAVATTGGAAREQWIQDMAAIDEYRLGERPVSSETLALLDDADPQIVVGTTISLIRQGLFLA